MTSGGETVTSRVRRLDGARATRHASPWRRQRGAGVEKEAEAHSYKGVGAGWPLPCSRATPRPRVFGVPGGQHWRGRKAQQPSCGAPCCRKSARQSPGRVSAPPRVVTCTARAPAPSSRLRITVRWPPPPAGRRWRRKARGPQSGRGGAASPALPPNMSRPAPAARDPERGPQQAPEPEPERERARGPERGTPRC